MSFRNCQHGASAAAIPACKQVNSVRNRGIFEEIKPLPLTSNTDLPIAYVTCVQIFAYVPNLGAEKDPILVEKGGNGNDSIPKTLQNSKKYEELA